MTRPGVTHHTLFIFCCSQPSGWQANKDETLRSRFLTGSGNEKRGRRQPSPLGSTPRDRQVVKVLRNILAPNPATVANVAKRHKGQRGGSPRFVRLLHRLLDDPRYIGLSHTAKTLLIDAARHYNGRNNGDIAVTLTVMAKRGWNSNSTLRRALSELLKAELLMLTRQGGRNQCNLYALTWEPINECGGKLDVQPTITPPIPLSIPS